MSSAPESTDKGLSEALRAYAEMRGLGRACTLFPDAVAAAHARGSQPLGPSADNIPATTEPALRFVSPRGEP